MCTEGETRPCPMCLEEGIKGTLTLTKRTDTGVALDEDAAIPEPIEFWEWVCSGENAQHNRRPDEP